MTTFTVPKQYENRVGIIQDIGAYASKFGTKVLVIGSKTAFEKTKHILTESLSASGLTFEFEVVTGFPTLRRAQQVAKRLQHDKYDLVIGVGGGRAIDQAKAASALARLKLITIPTIAATCAAWAAVAILYDTAGAFAAPIFHPDGPSVILVDPEIILSAPKRFVYAGVIDTLAKLYEISPYLNDGEQTTTFQVMFDLSQRAHDHLRLYTQQALEEASRGVYTEAASLVIDAIIYLAGLTGSFQTGRLYQGLGHPFYNAATFFPETHALLHGELVGFGLLLQDEVVGTLSDDKLRLFAQFQSLVTLSDIGISSDKIEALAAVIVTKFGDIYASLSFTQDKKQLALAIERTNQRIVAFKETYEKN